MVILLAVLALVSLATLAYAGMSQREANKVQEQLKHLATHDPLTGLGNRTALVEQLERAVAGRGTARLSVLLIELDRFAAINDTYGHDVGDQLLNAAAGQIKKALLPSETLFRSGGPSFVVVSPDTTTSAAATARANDIQQAIRVQYRIDHDHLRISASIGIVVVDQRHTSAQIVLDDADAALAEAAKRQLGTSAVFEVSMRSRVASHDAEDRLRQALENEEFLLMYMPVVSLADSKIAGAEALLRWVDPERGLVSPGEFLGLLEETDLLGPVGDWVITQACLQNQTWRDRFPGTDLVTTINVSPRQLADPNFIDRVLRIISATGADPSRLCLEITEGAMRSDIDATWSMLRRAKDEGIQLALDDFGTGYSTFNYIRSFSLDVLKIDQVFVSRVAETNEDYAIVQQLIGMAHSLDFVAIAEGVDDAAQAETLKGLNCDLAQGYYWSRPAPIETMDKLIERGTVRPGSGADKKIDWSPAS